MSDENNIFDLDLMSQPQNGRPQSGLNQNESIEENDYSAIDNETSVSPDSVLNDEDQHTGSNDDILESSDNEREDETQQAPTEEAKNTESKKSPDDVIKQKKKGALKLNRQLILSIVVSLFLSLMLITFLSTGKKEKKKDDDKIKSAREAYMPDFEAIASSSYNSAVSNDSAPDVNAPSKFFQSDEDALIASANSKMPDLNGVGKAPVSPNQGGGNGQGYSRPDTRNNPIQKQIQGIKGLTPTGRQNQGYTGQINQLSINQEQGSGNPYSQFTLPSKEDFVKQILASQGMQGGYLAGYGTDNSGKENFYSKNIGSTSQGEFLNSLSLWQGTIIPAVLVTGINTDLPGNIIARVTKNIYSSLDGRFLLIPQGSLLFADYNSSVSYAQNRVQVAWTYMIRPDGFAVQLGNMSGVDNRGFAGYKGRVNNHPWAFLKGILLVSAISIADTDLSAAAKKLQTDPYAKNITERLQDPYKKITDKIIDRALDIQPTITIKSGIGINILTNTNLFLPPVEIPEVIQKYIRH